MKKYLVYLSSTLLLMSCATTMPGTKLDTNNKKIIVSMDTNEDLSNKRIQMLQFAIKNNTNEWMEFDGAKISGSDKVLVLVGDRLNSWIEACTLEKNVSEFNTSLLLGSLVVAGAVVAGSNNGSSGAVTTGAIMALGAIATSGVISYQDEKHKVEFQNAFPEKHIFHSFAVPPKKVIQRWLLVENPSDEEFKLTFKSKTGDEATIEL